MRIQRIVAHAFGPFHGEALDLADGMTVIYGPNEAGKSSWHAALRMALTGIRRGRGRMTAADAALSERHKPWDGPEAWEVEARLALSDGRVVDVRQDLAGKVACAAIDVQLGRDVSDEILDGTPDASRWLGLDRDAFASTISVEQAHVLAVADSADQLQEQMQRAAATRGTDETAAQAIERLAEFRREAVGADTIAAKGPLRTARARLQAATEAHTTARARHEEYLARAAATQQSGLERANAQLALELARAARAKLASDRAAARLARASELAKRHGSAPAPLGERDATADAVAAAVDGWARRPAPAQLDGPSASDLEQELTALPAVPEGDQAPHPDVLAAARAQERAAQALSAEQARAEVGAPVATRPAPIGWLAIGLFGLAGILVIVGSPLAGLLVAVAAAVAGAMWFRQRSGVGMSLGPQGTTSIASLQGSFQEAERSLRAALAARGQAADGDVVIAFERYRNSCASRAEQAAQAGRATSLHRELASRRAAEEAAASVQRTIVEIEQRVRDAVIAVGLASDKPLDQLVGALREWQVQRAEVMHAAQRANDEWSELIAILDGGTLDDLRQASERRAADAAEALANVPVGASEAFPAGTDLERLEQQRAAHLTELERDWHERRGALEALERDLPDVAEAEEALVAARAQLAQVQDLATVLDQTLELLREAQEKVHRDLAPVLASAVRRWLSTISDGAYDDVTVDPADLSVRVKEAATGQWRTAKLLSEGTREQIYLLLRVAMAQHLVTPGEIAPLILDEVTAQADERRRAALLSMLHELSAERQVILFSHDAEVARWAGRALNGDHDKLITLPALRDRGRKVIPMPIIGSEETVATRPRPREVAARS
jgi:recombinational DNA repair ATPase RecF